MSGVKWPHQTSPRELGSIVNVQVQLWEMRQEHRAGAPSEKGAQVGNMGQAGGPELGAKQNRVRHPWLHYWGDAIVAELTRLGQTHESSEAFLNDGMNGIPSNERRAGPTRFKWRSRPGATHTRPKRIANKT